jgi:decaprenylphospho-beta-D-ribofuranose 2-oxidase
MVPADERLGEDLARLTRDASLTRGLGRSYGDASLPPPDEPVVANSRLADRLVAFDDATGLLTAEAGLSLFELNRIFWPRGWASPVSPGTQYVTLGGMVAADVHGKNHHRVGTIGAHVTGLRMRLADGSIVDCSRSVEPDLFRATLGGMGLTGHILEATIRLRRIGTSWIVSWSRRFEDLLELTRALTAAAGEWPLTAAWVDGLGARPRGILLCGRWAEKSEVDAPAPDPRKPRLDVPFEAPSWLLSGTAVRLFNRAHWGWHGDRERQRIAHPAAFYYPLDGVGHWNRLYGRRGMTQHQSVLPTAAGPEAVVEFMTRVRALNGRPFLIVLKDFGAEGDGVLSFPRPGFTLALDFPVDAETQRLVDGLNEFVIAAGGRVYLAKDAFTRAEHFRKMEGERLVEFQSLRDRLDPQRLLRSRLSIRLMGDPA